jgi:hypothetical protein
MPDCADCGNSLEAPRDKNKAGWWRDCCLPCICERAPDAGRPRRDPATWLAETETPDGFREH